MSQSVAAYCAGQGQGSVDSGVSAWIAERIARFCELIGSGRARKAMDGLSAWLSAQRAALSADGEDGVAQVLLRHPLRNWVHREPLTLPACKKPGGSVGDAALVDLVYAAGAFHSYEQPAAASRAERIFAMPNSGGRIFIADFTPDIADTGYLENYIDSPRVYRGRREVHALVQGSPRGDITDLNFSFDGIRNFADRPVRHGTEGGKTVFRHKRFRLWQAACRSEGLRRRVRRRRGQNVSSRRS